MFLSLCRAGRILFRPIPVASVERKEGDKGITEFVTAFYYIIYRWKKEGLKSYLFVFSALLYVIYTVKQGGPPWIFW